MAKGDNSMAGSKDSSTPAKMDQYSVMHSIMDKLGEGGGSISPSVMPRSPDQGQMGMTPNSNNFGQISPQINYPDNQGSPMGGRMQPMGTRIGSMYGVTAGAPSIGPSNPQDMMRRTMMGKGVYNSGNASNPMI